MKRYLFEINTIFLFNIHTINKNKIFEFFYNNWIRGFNLSRISFNYIFVNYFLIASKVVIIVKEECQIQYFNSLFFI